MANFFFRHSSETLISVIPAKAGKIRLERISTAEGGPRKGQSPWMDFVIQFLIKVRPEAATNPDLDSSLRWNDKTKACLL